jgi:hypothetical protein
MPVVHEQNIAARGPYALMRNRQHSTLPLVDAAATPRRIEPVRTVAGPGALSEGVPAGGRWAGRTPTAGAALPAGAVLPVGAARPAGTAPPVGAARPAGPAAHPSTTAPTKIDIDRLVEKAERRLMRRLAMESERRGITR